MRCLSKITDTQGNEFNLMQINDFSVITSEIKGKGVAETRIYQQSSHSVPSWISIQGDKIFSSSTMSSDEKYLVNDDYTLIAYNHITVGGDNFYGTAMYNKLNSNARAGGGGDSNPSSYGLDQWLGIVLDDDNQRAYLIFATDKYNAGSNNYYRVYVETGNYNGTDIYWETFGEVILNQSAGGGGLYGGYVGGAGSGYIGNSLVSNKKMVGYNVPTSSAEGTKTESVNDVSANPVSGKPKSGNGFAKVKFLRDINLANMEEYIPDADFGWTVTFDSNTSENHITGRGNEYWEYYECPVSVKKNTNYILSCQYKGSGMYYSTSNKDYLRIFNRFVAESEIRANNGLYGISGLTIIAESTDYFDSNSTYRDISVSFNSGNLSEVWACIGFGYGDYDANIFDVYFKNIQLTEV